MVEPHGSAPAKETRAAVSGGAPRTARMELGLELVAMRGKDVIGVRHLLEGGTAWVGNVAEAIARIPTREFGSEPVLVGNVVGGTFAVHVPPAGRGRVHTANGIPRLVFGPRRVELGAGDRAVLVLGSVQIRAQVVPIANSRGGVRRAVILGAWIAFIVALYLVAIAHVAGLAWPATPRPTGGTPLPAPAHQHG